MSDNTNLYGGYEDAEDLANKIHNEGFDYFFGDYTDHTSFIGSDLEKPVKAYIDAKEHLKRQLKRFGVDLDNIS